MRLEETGLRITENAVLAHNAAGEILSEYRRLKSPLDLWRRNGLRQTEYEAGLRYGALWREAVRPKSESHSDPTRIIVDGGFAPGDRAEITFHIRGLEAEDELRSVIVGAAIDAETVAFLNRLCGMEDWPQGDKRRFKRLCRKGLERLVDLWRRR